MQSNCRFNSGLSYSAPNGTCGMINSQLGNIIKPSCGNFQNYMQALGGAVCGFRPTIADIISAQVETAFADLVGTPLICALTECDEVENPFAPEVVCYTRYTTYWTVLTTLSNGVGRSAFRFPKAGDYLLEVVAVLATPPVVLTADAVLAGFRVAWTRNVGAIMLQFSKFTVNNVELINFDYNYIIAYWNFALTEGKFNAYRFAVGDVPTLTAPQIALQPYVLTVPIPFYFGNQACRAFPLVGAGFSDIQVNLTSALTWADVLIVYKVPIAVDAQLALLSKYCTTNAVCGERLAPLLQPGGYVSAEVFGMPSIVDPNVVQGLASYNGYDTQTTDNYFMTVIGNVGGGIGCCVLNLLSGLLTPNSVVNSICGMQAPVECINDDVEPGLFELLNVSALPLGQPVIPRNNKTRGRYIPQNLWRQNLSQNNTGGCLFKEPALLTTSPDIVAIALYGIVTNSLRTSIQSCKLDYPLQTVQLAGSATVQNAPCTAYGGGSFIDITLNFLYAVTALVYLAENETSKQFGIWGNYSASMLSYAGPDPIAGMELSYESSSRFNSNSEVLTRLEALNKAPRYPRSLHDARLNGNCFTSELEGTPNYFNITDDINGLNFVSYGTEPFTGCAPGGVVDYGTLTVTFRARMRSANPNCGFVHSNGGDAGFNCDGSNIPPIPSLFPEDPATCLPQAYTIHIYAIAWQILRFNNGMTGWVSL